MGAFTILVGIAIILCVVGMIWPNHIILSAAVLFLAVAELIAHRGG